MWIELNGWRQQRGRELDTSAVIRGEVWLCRPLSSWINHWPRGYWCYWTDSLMNGVLLQGVWLCSWLACLQASNGTKQQKNKTKKKFLFITSCVIVSTTIYEYLELFVEELLMQWTTSISHFFGFNKLSVYIWMHAVFFYWLSPTVLSPMHHSFSVCWVWLQPSVNNQYR